MNLVDISNIGVFLSLSISTLAFAAGTPADDLEQSFTLDERERMHRELDQFSSNYYPGHVQLEERRRHMLRERFKQADQDNDGTLTREEAEVHMPGLAKHFDEMDIDNDGLVSVDEILSTQAKQREAREAQTREDTDRAIAPPLRSNKSVQKKRAKSPSALPDSDIKPKIPNPLDSAFSALSNAPI